MQFLRTARRATAVAARGATAAATSVALGCSSSVASPDDAPYPPERTRFSCNTPGPVASPPAHPFTFTFDAPTQVARGRPVAFTLTVRNASPDTAYLWTGLPNQALNVVIRRADDRTVWDRILAAYDGAFELIARSRPLAPGGSERFQVTWDQVGLNGRPVPPGEYRVFATLANSWYTGSKFAELPDMEDSCGFRSEAHPLTVTAP